MKNIMIVATRHCNHRHILEDQLKELGVPCVVQCVDDDTSLIKKYDIQHSPNIIVDGKVVFRGSPERRLPTFTELKVICEKKNSRHKSME